MRYIPDTDADRKAMLAAIGRSSAEELFADIPQIVKDRFQPLGLSPKSEMEVRTELGSFTFLALCSTLHHVPNSTQRTRRTSLK